MKDQKLTNAPLTICVVIPAFKVVQHIVKVVKSIGLEVNNIIVVDDACPEFSGRHLQEAVSDPRLEVLYHTSNKGVGGA